MLTFASDYGAEEQVRGCAAGVLSAGLWNGHGQRTARQLPGCASLCKLLRVPVPCRVAVLAPYVPHSVVRPSIASLQMLATAAAEGKVDPAHWPYLGPTRCTSIVACIPAYVDASGASVSAGSTAGRGGSLGAAGGCCGGDGMSGVR